MLQQQTQRIAVRHWISTVRCAKWPFAV